VFGFPPGADRDVVDNATPDVIVGALGFVPEDFSDTMRAGIVAAQRARKIVRLISNRAELRDYAKREIALALAHPLGSS
jgi:hypothetical protein